MTGKQENDKQGRHVADAEAAAVLGGEADAAVTGVSATEDADVAASGEAADDSGLTGSAGSPAAAATSTDPSEGAARDFASIEDEIESEDTAAAEATVDAGEPVEQGPATTLEDTLLEDLRRLTAEFANYRKRTQEQEQLQKERALARALGALLPVLDDLDRAEQHGDLAEGGQFHAVAQKLRTIVAKLGLTGFGVKGEPFDPAIHEGIARVPVAGAEEETVLDVIERGYRLGDVELRPAKVAVAVADG